MVNVLSIKYIVNDFTIKCTADNFTITVPCM